MGNKIAVITGGSGNIGQKICEILKNNKYYVVVFDKVKPKKNFDYFQKIDLSNHKQIKKITKNISNKYKSIELLVNCAAMVGSNKIKGWNTNFFKQSLKSWNKCLDINLTSVFLVTQILIKNLNRSSKPKIINVSSIYGSLAPRFQIYLNSKINNILAYSVSKAGLEQMTRWLSAFLGKKYSVNSISFGGLYNKQDKKFVRKYSEYTFKKRMMKIDDIVPVVQFLIDENQNYVTGQNIFVDGGWSVF